MRLGQHAHRVVTEGTGDQIPGVPLTGRADHEYAPQTRVADLVAQGGHGSLGESDAHRQRLVITVAGELSSTTGRVELVPGRRFEL